MMESVTSEIDEGTSYIGYKKALDLILSNIRLMSPEKIPLELSLSRIAAADMAAAVSCPPEDVSLKDGFAIRAADIALASSRQPVALEIIGSAFAGSAFHGEVKPGTAVKVCSGAPIPAGANAVVPVEFCEETSKQEVLVGVEAEPGRNILREAEDVKKQDIIIRRGNLFSPGILGLAAAAGIHTVSVYRHPKASILAVGDEVVEAGESLKSGQIYASNLITLKAWLSSFCISSVTAVSKDNAGTIKLELEKARSEADVILTSGGAWGSERDLVIGTLDSLKWQKIFHHVRMGPGKGIAFGLWQGTPVFCLPGGPASNEMSFLQLALPGILQMCGNSRHPLQTVPAELTEDVRSRHKAWTEFRDAVLVENSKGQFSVSPCKNRGRLQAITAANSLICIPEGTHEIHAGDVIPVQLLTPFIQ